MTRQCVFTGRDIELDRRNERNLIAWRKRWQKHFATGQWVRHVNVVDKPNYLRERAAL
jgi:hypothetical protein